MFIPLLVGKKKKSKSDVSQNKSHLKWQLCVFRKHQQKKLVVVVDDTSVLEGIIDPDLNLIHLPSDGWICCAGEREPSVRGG